MSTATWRALGAVLGVLVGPPAWASSSQQDADDIESVAGKRLPEIRLLDPKSLGSAPIPLDQVDAVGAQLLGLDERYVRRTRHGFGLVFERKYKAARKHFEILDAEFPGTGISGTVDALIWQALMLENFDFRYDKQYAVSNGAAIKGLEKALKDPAHQAWEHFQLAGLKGVEAIHMVRHGTYLGALNRAFEAMDHVQSARKESPGYTDLGLADGMYNYWRTVVTMSSKMLPSFGDQRSLGIQQLQDVEQRGIFLREPATLALAFTWLEERKFKNAAEACERNRVKYPDNVINNLLGGSSYTFMNRHADALEIYEHIRKTAPENQRVYYYLGLTHVRMGNVDQGIGAYERYLSAEHLEDWQRSSTLYRLAQARYRQRDFAGAERDYKAAIKVDGHKPSKQALDRMLEMKKAGRISW